MSTPTELLLLHLVEIQTAPVGTVAVWMGADTKPLRECTSRYDIEVDSYTSINRVLVLRVIDKARAPGLNHVDIHWCRLDGHYVIGQWCDADKYTAARPQVSLAPDWVSQAMGWDS